VGALGAGVGLGVLADVLGLFALGFLLATAAAALAIVLDLLGAGVERLVVSPGVRQRSPVRSSRRRGRSTQTSTQEAPTASTAR